MRRILLFLLSPLWITLAAISLVIGLAFYGETNPATLFVASVSPDTLQGERILYLLARLVLLPFQLGFIGLAFGVALWIFRRRARVGAWVLGEPVAERIKLTEGGDEFSVVLPLQRRRTLHQIISSIIAVLALGAALVLALGQFIPRGELAVVITALTGSLTWGARLPVGDLLGGISNIFETNVSVGDRIRYRQMAEKVEGSVESIDLRFLAVRADTGELTTIPHGELRIFRNFSRGETTGVYVTIPVLARDLSRAVALLRESAGESPSLVSHLVAPWQVMSLEGKLGRVVDLSLFGQTVPGCEDDLQLALYTVVQDRFAAEGIALAGSEAAE